MNTKYKKFNSTYNFSSNNNKKSYIWLYLRDEIETLLCSTLDELPNIPFDDAYVFSPEKEYETMLESFYQKKEREQLLFLTGLTGSGKTTILKKVFRIFNHKPLIVNNSIIIPFKFDNFDSEEKSSFDENVERINERITNILLSATTKIKQSQELQDVKERIDEYIEFVDAIHSDTLYFKNKFCESNEEIFSELRIQKRYEYAMLLLKFYLLDNKCKINNIIFILDDIESVGHGLEIKPIKKLFRIYECMHNIPLDKKGKYNTNCIISCRHFVYREVTQSAKNSKEMESYARFNDVDYGGTIDLLDIIDKRAKLLMKIAVNNNKKTAIHVVNNILKMINKNSDNFILHLNLNDLRKSLLMLKKLVYNYTWIQREQHEPAPGSFTIKDYNQFNVYFPNILRALGCGNDVVYSRYISDIPNLLENSYFSPNPLFKLLIIKYFIMRNQNWDKPISIDSLFEDITVTFQREETINLFKEKICVMLHDRLLLRGKDSNANDVDDITINQFDEIKEIYLPAVSNDLWNLLGENSILFQLFLDDIYLPENLIKDKDSNFDLYKFEHCFECLDWFIDQEQEIVLKSNNRGTIDKYIYCFSNEPICQQIFIGLEKSINKYFTNTESEEEIYKSISNKLNHCKEKINKLEKMFN